MNVANLIAKMKRFDQNAEIIFDWQEPVGTPTDLVMPRRRWFRKKLEQPARSSSLHLSIPR